MRSWFPRFTPEARQANQPIVTVVQAVADRRSATPAQVALAWILAQRPWIVPIPGTRNPGRLEENLAAASVELAGEDLHQLDEIASRFAVQGARGTGREQHA